MLCRLAELSINCTQIHVQWDNQTAEITMLCRLAELSSNLSTRSIVRLLFVFIENLCPHSKNWFTNFTELFFQTSLWQFNIKLKISFNYHIMINHIFMFLTIHHILLLWLIIQLYCFHVRQNNDQFSNVLLFAIIVCHFDNVLFYVTLRQFDSPERRQRNVGLWFDRRMKTDLVNEDKGLSYRRSNVCRCCVRENVVS